jgi:hypothetical protein
MGVHPERSAPSPCGHMFEEKREAVMAIEAAYFV